MLESKVTNVTLEKFEYDDVYEYFSIAKDEKVKTFFRMAYCDTLEEAKEFMELCIESSNYIAFKILNSSCEIVGIILGEKKAKKILEVSYFIGKEHREHGYCQNAIKLFEQYVLQNTKYRTLEFCIACNNEKSKHVMQALKVPKAYVRRFIHYQKRLPM